MAGLESDNSPRGVILVTSSNDDTTVLTAALHHLSITVETATIVVHNLVVTTLNEITPVIEKLIAKFAVAKRRDPKTGWREVIGFGSVSQVSWFVSFSPRSSPRENIGCWNFCKGAMSK